MLRIFNTLSGKKERLVKPKSRALRLFVCGTTVYDLPHLGHARTYVAFDNIVRYLRSSGLKVFYLQNVTDVDDKIIDRAKKQKKDPLKLAHYFEKESLKDMKAIGVNTVTQYARASNYIKEIQIQIARLIKKGFAYQTNSGIYFEIRKFKYYGKLSKQNLNALRPGYRIEPDAEKKDLLDFTLWKLKKDPTEPSWPSPWGKGRPGWHIEDTAISESFFGPQYDLHGGAVELKFPHHESEIAQQEAASGKKPFVKIWLHTGWILVNGEKMSKSLGNFITIRDFLKKYPPAVLRLFITAHHYRSPIDYTENIPKQTEASLKRLQNFLARLNLIKKSGPVTKENKIFLKKSAAAFEIAMEDDFNTPDALAALFNLINQVEPKIWSLNKSEIVAIKDLLAKKMAIFGINLKKTDKIPPQITQIAKKRELYRTHKQFAQADGLRKEIEKLGYIVEDTPVGPLILKSH